MSVVRSGLFSLGSQVFQIAITFAGLAVLGRLLTPDDFGLFGILLATQMLFLPVLDMGLTPAFIKLDDVGGGTSDAFFTINCALGLINVICLLLAAKFLVGFYNCALLWPLMAAFSFSVLFDALRQQPLAVLVRSKRFAGLMVANVVGQTAGTLAGIYAAVQGAGVWSLIVKALIQSLAHFLAVVAILRTNYRIVRVSEIRKYWASIRYGIEIVGSRLLGGALGSLDKLILGRLYGLEFLGHYTRAAQLAQMPDANIRATLSTPALAHIARHEESRRIASYRLLCSVLLTAAGVPCLMLMVAGDWLILLVMGHQWVYAGEYVRLMGVWGLGMVVHGICAILFMNEMRTRTWLWFHVLCIPVILGAPLLMALYGYGTWCFIVGLSLSNILFWCAVFMYGLAIFSGGTKLSLQVGWTLISGFFTTIPLGLLVRNISSAWLPGNNSLHLVERLALVFLTVLLGYLVSQILLNRKQMLEMYGFLIRRSLS